MSELDADLLASLDERLYDSETGGGGGSGSQSVAVSVTFSAYRELSRQLESCRVFGMDNDALLNGEPGDMIVDAAFPATLAKSKLGLALTPAEAATR